MSINIAKTSEIYSTTDLACATAISLFYPIWAIDKSNPTKAEFIFQRDDGLDKVIKNFWANNLNVSALAYFQQLKIIKSRLYEEK